MFERVAALPRLHLWDWLVTRKIGKNVRELFHFESLQVRVAS